MAIRLKPNNHGVFSFKVLRDIQLAATNIRHKIKSTGHELLIPKIYVSA
jgi:hypothetical protein